MAEPAENDRKVQSFVPQDPTADIIGADFSLYITKKAPERAGFRFEGYMWSAEGCGIVRDGFIDPTYFYLNPLYEKEFDGRKIFYHEWCQGDFSPETSLYYYAKRNSDCEKFALKNQGVKFNPARPPLPPFSLYKQSIFGEIKKQNPEKKFSELNSIIAQKWTGLDKEIKSVYQLDYDELVKKYQETWRGREFISCYWMGQTQEERNLKGSITSKDEGSQNNCYLIKINKTFYYGGNCSHWNFVHNKDDPDLIRDGLCKSYVEKKASWLSALEYIQGVYRLHHKEMEEDRIRRCQPSAKCRCGKSKYRGRMIFEASISCGLNGTEFQFHKKNLNGSSVSKSKDFPKLRDF